MNYANYLHILTVVLLIMVYYLYTEKHGLVVYWFHRPGCPHCDNMKSDWESVEKQMAGSSITLKRIDTSKPQHKKLAKNFGVDGVPQIIKVTPNGMRAEYDGDRTSDNIIEWISHSD